MNKVAGLSLYVLMLVVLLSNIFVNCQLQQQQYISIYNASGCTGTPLGSHNASATSSNITIPSSTPTVYVRTNGLWSVQPCSSASCSARVMRSGSNGVNCDSLSINTGSDRVVVTRFGDQNQVAKEIYFFTEGNLLGSSTPVGENGISGQNIAARSYFFTGPNSWLVNNQTCLNYTSASIGVNGYGVTFAFSYNVQVTTVRLGCQTTPTPTTTRPPVTTAPTVTTSRVTGTGPTVTTPRVTTLKPCNATANECSSGFKFSVSSAIYLLISISLFWY